MYVLRRTDFILPSYHVSGVLHASFDCGLMFEAHLCPELEGADGRTRNGRLRIAHIVIRTYTRLLADEELSYADRIASTIEDHLLTLSHLQSITLETFGADKEDTELAGRLCVLRERGILYRRTCEESWQMAQEAVKNPTLRAEQHNIVSPMWYADESDNDFDCSGWCVIVSRSSRIPQSATELIMLSHRFGLETGSDRYKKFAAQRTELRKKFEEFWAQCDEEA